ncbi:RING-CH-type domain-containing protein [Mycena venus]|uniref:RING-CH-type domain-containing protein n=1 Tax=Mycena venus TaxID=2733690 RepID=A0A8H6XWL2_9AGAR|nr:RING-CH-type domain-containing protein [Mycena venus]
MVTRDHTCPFHVRHHKMPVDDRQCRICLCGTEEEAALGRLIKPCLCKGSISFVHLKCLQRWRNSSASQSAFFSCPQCHYKYRFARTRIVGIATNPAVVGALSAILFTMLVLLSSFITTFFMSWFEEPSDGYYYRSSWFFGPGFYFTSPFDIARDIIRAALRILQDTDGEVFGHRDTQTGSPIPHSEPGLLKSFIRRFLLGLPIVGAGSVVHMLLSVGLLTPVHFLARYRSSNRRRESGRDIASLIVIGLVLVGAARALVKVYSITQSLTKRALLRAEDAILEV